MSDVDSFKQGGWREVSPDSDVEVQEKTERERQEKMEEFMVKSTEELLAELSDVKDGLRAQQERLDKLTQLLENKIANEQQEKKDATSEELPTEPLIEGYTDTERSKDDSTLNAEVTPEKQETESKFKVGDSVIVQGENDWQITDIRIFEGKIVYDLVKNNPLESGAQKSMYGISEEHLLEWQITETEVENSAEWQEVKGKFVIGDRVVVEGDKDWRIVAIRAPREGVRLFTVEKNGDQFSRIEVDESALSLQDIDKGDEAEKIKDSGKIERLREEAEKLSAELDEKRKKYVELLQSLQLKRWWKKPNDAERDVVRSAYKEALAKYAEKQAELNVEELVSPENDIEDKETKINQEIIKIKIEEYRKLSAVGAEIATGNGRWEKFKERWAKHKKLRLAFGIGIAVAGFAAGPLGAGTSIAVGLAVAKGAFSGVGGAVAAESAMDMGQNAFEKRRGDTKLFSDEELQALGFKEVDRALAARLAKGIEEHKDATVDPATKELIDGLLQRSQEEHFKAIAEYKEHGLNDHEIRAKLLGNLLDDENIAHENANERRGRWGRNKRIAAVVIGGAVGAGSFLWAYNQIHPSGPDVNPSTPGGPNPESLPTTPGNTGNILDIPPTAPSAEHLDAITRLKPDGESLSHYAHRMVNLYEQHNGLSLSSAEKVKAAQGLADMWQGPTDTPGAGVLIDKSIRLTATPDMVKAALAR